MDKRPAWVPEWAWEECAKLASLDDAARDDLLQRIYSRMRSVVDSKGSAAFWRAVANRRGMLERSGGELLGDAGLGALELLLEVAENAEGVPHGEALSHKDRQKLGRAVARQASALRETLCSFRSVDDRPRAFGNSLDDFAREYATHYKPSEGLDGQAVRPQDSPKIEAACIAGYSDALSDMTLDNFCGALDALVRAGDALADSMPPVAQLASRRAARLYFVRQTTVDMRFHFHQPLREAVAALANVLFPQDPAHELDAAGVAKLAP